ncbi:tetraspanin-8-like [Amphiprion ocellaris]|uniref:tetraspanin-8-like n=1 Tax=Amphiprion ocellaris TaxID=80972 RepID=UPI001649E917|nr:tetraspanin-8-like [Amphiprion ocellaris]
MTVSKVIKYLLATFNLLFYVGVIFILGFFANIRINKADHRITDELLPAIDLVIFIGVGTMIFGCLDRCAAVRENRCLLALLFLGLLTMFVMLLAVGALGAVSRTAAVQELVREHVEQFLPLSEQPEEVQESIRQVERTSFCCGFFAGHLDWGNSMAVPDSCNCIDTSMNCTALDGREVYSTPCMIYAMTWLDRLPHSLIVTAFASGLLLMLAMIFSVALFCQSNNSIVGNIKHKASS